MIDNEKGNPCFLEYDRLPRFIGQVCCVTQRTFCDVLRNPALVALQMISMMIYGLFPGLIFHKLERTVHPGVYNRFGAIFLYHLSSRSSMESLEESVCIVLHHTDIYSHSVYSTVEKEKV